VTEEFETFVEDTEPRLRRALTAAYGPEDGREATAEALAWTWEHWERVRNMENAIGYLYRVGQSSRRRRKTPILLPNPPADGPTIEPRLLPALRELTDHQRVAVLLVHGYSYTHEEVAVVLDVGVSTVRNHLRRGLRHLRRALGEVVDA
jgi:DNA-directed RNA polymerase specialized sigma24 family protein